MPERTLRRESQQDICAESRQIPTTSAIKFPPTRQQDPSQCSSSPRAGGTIAALRRELERAQLRILELEAASASRGSTENPQFEDLGSWYEPINLEANKSPVRPKW